MSNLFILQHSVCERNLELGAGLGRERRVISTASARLQPSTQKLQFAEERKCLIAKLITLGDENRQLKAEKMAISKVRPFESIFVLRTMHICC